LGSNDDGVRGRGVAIQTTLEALEASVTPHKLVVRPITYRYHHDADDAYEGVVREAIAGGTYVC